MPANVIMLPLGPIQTNCYIVGDTNTRQAAVIDPGWDAPEIVTQARNAGLTIDVILLTHAHFDHIGGVAALVKATKAPLAIHPLDLPLLRELGGAKLWDIPIEPPPEPTLELEAGQVLEIGDLRLEVLFVPGHTPGHVAFYERKEALLFGGDVLFQQGIGRTDFPGGSYPTLIKSIREQFLTLPDETVVYSGHGEPTTIGEERQWNPFLG